MFRLVRITRQTLAVIPMPSLELNYTCETTDVSNPTSVMCSHTDRFLDYLTSGSKNWVHNISGSSSSHWVTFGIARRLSSFANATKLSVTTATTSFGSLSHSSPYCDYIENTNALFHHRKTFNEISDMKGLTIVKQTKFIPSFSIDLHGRLIYQALYLWEGQDIYKTAFAALFQFQQVYVQESWSAGVRYRNTASSISVGKCLIAISKRMEWCFAFGCWMRENAYHVHRVYSNATAHTQKTVKVSPSSSLYGWSIISNSRIIYYSNQWCQFSSFPLVDPHITCSTFMANDDVWWIILGNSQTLSKGQFGLQTN